MTLRKITIDNNVRYISKAEQILRISKERESKPSTRKKNAYNVDFSQNNEKVIRNITAEGFRKIKEITICYFQQKNILIF